MFGGEEVVAALAFEVARDAAQVVVAEETVEDGRFVEAGYYEAPDVGDERDEGGWLLVVAVRGCGVGAAVHAVGCGAEVGCESELGVGVGW